MAGSALILVAILVRRRRFLDLLAVGNTAQIDAHDRDLVVLVHPTHVILLQNQLHKMALEKIISV